ncbi:MAG: diaminopimelate epimerase [Dehalococcoidia bacterium]|nr:diaminopimelate epimerase [Dehalococcoidia bacterium]
MQFTKLQGLGNDFVMIDARGIIRNWSSLAGRVCDRHRGIGADGLLALLSSDKADFRMRIFNPDGSEAETCGNGLRCFVRYLYEQRLIENATCTIETMAGVRPAKVINKPEGGTEIRVGMGSPEFNPDRIPVAATPEKGRLIDIMLGDYPLEIAGHTLKLNFVSMGNPHAVCFTDEPVAGFPLQNIGQAIGMHPLFPQGVNFEIARVTGDDEIEMRVWERGAGETLACGSGACAVAIAGHVLGLTTTNVYVILPGGRARVDWDKTSQAFLTGPAETVFTGEWPE